MSESPTLLPDEHGSFPTLRLLISYWYFRNVDLAKWLKQFRHPVQIFADSGAYSAHSHGKTIDVGEYADWLHKWKNHFDWYASLDVKGNQRVGLTNLAELEKRGLSPIPVFHGGDEFSVLDDFITHGYRYIALGNIAGTASARAKSTMAFLVNCFLRAEGKSVFHGFGITTPDLLWQLPWYSVDSSSWSAGFRFGAVAIYIRDEKRVLYLRHVKREPTHRELWEKYKGDVQRHGQNILDFMHYEIRQNPRYAIMGAAAFTLMGQHIRDTRPLVPFPDGSQPDGPHLYLATMGLPKNLEKNTKGRAWYELDAIRFLDDNLEIYS